MPELRKDPIVGRWVIIATERGARPSDFKIERPSPNGKVCPFCPGNESITPPEIIACRPKESAKDGAGWSVRVIPNKFPALRIEGDLGKIGFGIYDKMNGIGAHEVIIESPDHDATLASLPLSSFRDVLWSYRERIVDLKRDQRFRYALIFKNHGEAAGASLEHTHSQLIALPVVPQTVAIELEGCQTFYNYRDRCIFCDIIRQEQADGARLIFSNSSFVVLAPYASRFPFETWIIPKHHSGTFDEISAQEMEDLTQIFSMALGRLAKLLNQPPYNFVLHTAPFDGNFRGSEQYYHWHFEIMPTLSRVAGFEWGTGFFINPTAPEEAARLMRESEELGVDLNP